MTEAPACCVPSCTRPIVWTVTARDNDQTALIVVHACSWHGDQARWEAWTVDKVQVVETREAVPQPSEETPV